MEAIDEEKVYIKMEAIDDDRFFSTGTGGSSQHGLHSLKAH